VSTPKESVALTVTLKVPTGVPGSGGGPLLPPPPQAVIVVREAKRRSDRNALQRRRREEVPTKKRAAKIPPVPVAQMFRGRMLAVFGAVVLMDNTVVPLPVTEGGTKLQELSAGRPVQDATLKLTVLL